MIARDIDRGGISSVAAKRRSRTVATIRPALPGDTSQICDIYNRYVEQTVITFEEETVSNAEMSRRIADTTMTFPWFVAERNGSIAGYAYATTWKSRSAYRFAVESAIYLKPDLTGQGIGHELYETLIGELRKRRVHCVIGGIALPNPASIALHEKLGFSKIGQFREVGRKHDIWVDVGYWELVLNSGKPPDGTASSR
jgi:phosphinothricin acetyltransferase